ncbi:MAG: ASPIC/UnbV domain-containing protein [Terriglobales bacterium]
MRLNNWLFVQSRCHRGFGEDFSRSNGTSNGTSIPSRLVKGGSSYLSQSELRVTFGLGKRDKIDRLVIEWPSEERKNIRTSTGRSYECVESKGITAQPGF